MTNTSSEKWGAACAYPLFPAEKPDIRLIALDLDDTLLTDGLIITPRTKNAIRAAREQGIVVTLATGRMFSSALPYALELALDAPLIVYQGAMIAMADGRVLSHRTMDKQVCIELLAFLASLGCHVNVYHEDKLYIEQSSPEAERYGKTIRANFHIVPNLLAMMEEKTLGATKFAVLADAARVKEISAALGLSFGGRISQVASKPNFLEIGRPDAGKGAALAEMAAGLHIGQEQIMAIGDSPNDTDMITYAGWGVVMANGDDAVKGMARWITASNEEEGVAIAIEALALK